MAGPFKSHTLPFLGTTQGAVYVPTQSGYVLAGNGASPISTFTFTLPAAISPGNACFICVNGAGGGGVGADFNGATLTDNASNNTYHQSQTGYDPDANFASITFYALNVQNSPTTLTVTLPYAADYVSLVIDTFSGLATTIGDGVAAPWNGQTSPGTATGAISSTTFTPGSTGELIWAIMLDLGSVGGDSVATPGYTAGQSAINTFYTAHSLSTSTSPQTVGWTSSNGSSVYTTTAIVVPVAGYALTGTVNETLGALTSSATATSSDLEALSATLGPLTLAGTAASTTKNTLSKTLGALTGPGYAPGTFTAPIGINYVPYESGTYHNGSASTASFSPTIPAITQGNAAFVFVAGVPQSGSFSTWTLTDNASPSNTYTQFEYQSLGSGQLGTVAFYALDLQGSPTQLQLSDPAGDQATYVSLVLDVFSGVSAASVQVGVTANGQGFGGSFPGTGTDAITSGNITLANPGNFLWSATVDGASSGHTAYGTGWTGGQNDGASYYTEYQKNVAAGTYAGTYTNSVAGGTDPYATVILALNSPVENYSVSKTLGGIGIDATGLVPVPPYTASDTLGSLSSSSTGTVTGHATLSVTLGPASGVATGKFEVPRSATVSVTLGSLTAVGGMASSDHSSLTRSLGALQSAATGTHTDHAHASVTLGVATLRGTLGSEVKNTLSQTLGALTLHATSHNEATDHFTLSATLGAVTATFVRAKTKFNTVNPRTHLTVLGYQPGTPPVQNFPVG